MKPSALKSIRKTIIYSDHLNRNPRAQVACRLTHVSGGEPGTYENVLAEISGGNTKDWPINQLYFLESYGDDMSEEIKRHLRIASLGVVLDPASWRCFLFEVDKSVLRLYPLSVLETRDDERRQPPGLPTFRAALNHKRPYHFEIDHSLVEAFIEREIGWEALRRGLLVVVRAGRQYVARLEVDAP